MKSVFFHVTVGLLGLQVLAAVVFRGAALAELRDWDLSRSMNGLRFERAEAWADPTPDQPTLRCSRMRSLGPSKHHAARHSGGTPSSSGQLHARLQPRGPPRPDVDGLGVGHSWQNITSVGAYSTQYAVRCTWNRTPVWLLFDTGSSDTWAAQTGFQCLDRLGERYPEGACGFGRPLIGDFGQGTVEDVHFYLKYGSQEVVWGPMGYSDISCGGVTVARQQVGLANHTYWHGNNVTVGILGLAYPSLTSAYTGAVGDEGAFNAVPYPPFLTQAIAQGSIAPVFSVAIMKNSSDGILAWGGLPPLSTWVGSGGQTRRATADLIIANLINQADTGWQYSFYTIVPDGVRWGQTSNTAKYPYIVDTGTTMVYLPPPLAEAVAQAFQPEAEFLYQWGAYFAPCHAIPPAFAVVISGVDFWLDPAQMIYKDLVDPTTGYCAIAIGSGGSGPYILGDAFLQNVVAVFDVGAAQMRFYGRTEK